MSRVPQFPRINPDLVHETIEGETVVVNLESGSYYSLVGVGSVIWTELEAGRTVDEIITLLTREYDASHQEIETAIREFLESLVQEEIVSFEVHAEGSSAIEPASAHSPESVSIQHKFQAPRLQKFTDMQELLLLDPVHDADESGWPHSDN